MKFSQLYDSAIKQNEKLAVLTAYDYSFAKIFSEAGIDIILVGDSLANVVLGHRATANIGLSEMIYHSKAVRRGAMNSYIMVDMPYGCFESSKELAMNSAVQLVKAGADCIKIEGGLEVIPTVEFIVKRGIRVCLHLGLMPQRFAYLGGYNQQAGEKEDQQEIVKTAKLAYQVGADFLLLEAVPSIVAKNVKKQVGGMITIGIGAGIETHAQVLVCYDVFGISPKIPKFAKVFLDKKNPTIHLATKQYIADIKNLAFPSK